MKPELRKALEAIGPGPKDGLLYSDHDRALAQLRAEAQRDALLVALREYGDHKYDCERNWGSGRDCSCGLIDIFKLCGGGE